ncbi:MAG: DUF2493 domain-containing protein [Gammaproteobacteria bacterium]|nr:DUF2493 domain-containing protein [Gammaproteobacteria bacterium]
MRVLVCGGRYFKDINLAYHTLDRINGINRISVIIHGNARGGDSMGKAWAETKRLPQDIHKPNWDIPHLTQTKPPGYTGVVCRYGNSLRPNWEDLITEPTNPKINNYGDWYNVKAGFNRNGLMLKNGKPDLVVAFEGGNGTADMMRIARSAGVKVVHIVNEDSWRQYGNQTSLPL